LASINRRTFLLSAGLATAGALVLGDEGFVNEPNHPRLVRMEISLSRLPAAFDGFTIVHLSDFHYDELFSVVPIRKAIDIANGLNPDLVALTGDFVTVPVFSFRDEARWARAATPCAALLAKLTSRYGSFAVLGNHDVVSDPRFVAGALQANGISVLRNRSQPIERGNSRLWLCGLDSLEGRPDLAGSLKTVPKDEPVVLFMHEPDFADRAAKFPVDLQLSGHSHGGQVWVPGIGAPWLPFGARKYPRGRYQVGPLPLYTNVGLGTIRLPVRLNCIPEVTLITLRTDKN
jgi:uncharacterized protein